MKISVLAIDKWFTTCFDEEARARLSKLGWSGATLGDTVENGRICELIKNSDAAITSWDSPAFDADVLSHAPNLKLILHAAGSVKPLLCPEIWQRGIKVVSSASAIAIGVAEHSLGLMLSAMKNCYDLNYCMKNNLPLKRERIVELYKTTIGVVGCGRAGRHMIKLLKAFDVKILACDPFLSERDAKTLGVEKVELNELMSRGKVIALHAPQLPETKHMINKDNLKLLDDNAIIVNTARGWLIDEAALVEELKRRPIIAALDVTNPEPPAADSELRKLPNIILTPHIAGVAASNRFRIGELVVDEIERFANGKKLQHSVTEDELARLA
jgi:phosphoglycerate dehydrogenase-like enzyme